jgi:prolipoprotein diacylglyceryltransferase
MNFIHYLVTLPTYFYYVIYTLLFLCIHFFITEDEFSTDSCKQLANFYMFYTVHRSIIANKNQQNAQLYIFSQFIAPACFRRA